jgi:transcription initiation factor TFIIB
MTAHKPNPPADADDSSTNSPVRVRQRDESDAQTEESANSSSGTLRCPDCGGSVIASGTVEERHCRECGLILDVAEVKQDPWHNLANESRSSGRGRSSTDQTLHDRGLGTPLQYGFTDAYGNTLDASQQRRAGRLRRTRRKIKYSSENQYLRRGLSEIKRMSAALGIPDNIQETASILYRRAWDDGQLPGRSIESMSTAALALASRQHNLARSLDEFHRVSQLDDTRRITWAFRDYLREYDLEVSPPTPDQHLGQVISGLGFVDDGIKTGMRRDARRVLTALTDSRPEILSGRKPIGITAGAVWYVGLTAPFNLRQEAVAKAANISGKTVRRGARDIGEVEAVTSLDIKPTADCAPFETIECDSCGRDFLTETALSLHGSHRRMKCHGGDADGAKSERRK